jgi:hypothetical protein
VSEASKNKRRKHARLPAQPWCIYCGGVNKATTIDHMPPITIFDQRHRPPGLEFSACDPCNSGGRIAEKIIGFVSRICPDPATEAGRQELARHFREIARHHPTLLREMVPTRTQLATFQAARLPAGAALNARGPILNQAMNRFAAKLALALHFERTGAIASTSATVAFRWYSNHQAFTGAIPSELLKAVGHAGTLVQGKGNVGGQFLYAAAHTPSGKHSLYFAQFREAFALPVWSTTNSAPRNWRFPSRATWIFALQFVKRCNDTPPTSFGGNPGVL